MFIQACLNGARHVDEHAALPLTPKQLAAAAQAAVVAGAVSLHVHPRNANGEQSLAADDIAAAVHAIRAACPGVPIGVSTLYTIVPDAKKRVAEVEHWRVLPDFASVNVSEPGVAALCDTLATKGIPIEAGLATVGDAVQFVTMHLTGQCVRVLLEPEEQTIQEALATVAAIKAVLDQAAVRLPRLLHGFEATAWPLFNVAAQGGYDARVGFEDMLLLPNGETASDNSAIVRIAHERVRRQQSVTE